MVLNGPSFPVLTPPQRILMAPGPTNLPPAVSQALIAPLTGHKDPYFLHVMDETAELLRYVFQTNNQTTMSLPGTGGAGMEAAIGNLLQPGDTAVVCVNGLFGARMAEIARRAGAEIIQVDAPWGYPVDPDDVRKAIAGRRVKIITTVHGETSTGVEQPMDELGDIARSEGAFLVVDAVATLGGMAVDPDAWGSAICYGASQKCISAPPGLAPITISDAAMDYIRARSSVVPDWYFDLTQHSSYWFAEERVYHHTAPVLLVYALHEAARLIAEEGVEARWARHRMLQEALVAGLEAMDIELFAAPEYRLPTVLAIRVPDGISDARVRKELLTEYGIEIAGGLGQFVGKIWRVGVMGHSATRNNVILLLSAFEALLARQGYGSASGAGVTAASKVFTDTEAAVVRAGAQ
jgi:alanine-glyoxylate transaminase / serine-glyoxylate transaminase / serine-pyruvate transaminase